MVFRPASLSGPKPPLIVLFFMNVADVLASQEFCTWHEKYESNYPWISHSYVFIIHEVVRALSTISINYYNKAILSRDALSQPLPTNPSFCAWTKRTLYWNKNFSDTLFISSPSLLFHAPTSNVPLNGSLPHKLTNNALTTRKVLSPGETTIKVAVLVEIVVMPRVEIRALTPPSS